ncbi:uncharacterized protein LOC130648577 [Hydractinia symbiolongicarpus]|uniref:uncharacterized protein LOC130648577 n=1 Tax=Hydractinia symbiolongicarpus TaxID=13093 RepID=UPI0025511207|nr:uncharacterized protein LOC130648577 [Hydractinia symbiolongicarpus]
MSGSARDQQVECLKFEYTGDKNFYPGQPFQHRIEIPVGCDTTRYADYLKALQFINTRKNEIPRDLLSHLGHENPVSLYVANGRKVYKVQCPFLVCNYMGDRIDRHLEAVHRVKRRLVFVYRISNFISNLLDIFFFLRLRYYDRVDTHFRRVHGVTDAQIKEGLRVAQKISRNFNKYYPISLRTLMYTLASNKVRAFSICTARHSPCVWVG